MSHANEGAHGEAGAPHVLPFSTYLKVFAALLTLTAVTVGVSYVNVGAWNIAIALLVATIKATLVAAIFMHLWYDRRFNALVLGSTVFFLVVLLAFTMADTATRGGTDAIEGARPRSYSSPFVEGKPDLQGALPPETTAGEKAGAAAPVQKP